MRADQEEQTRKSRPGRAESDGVELKWSDERYLRAPFSFQ